MPAPRKTTTIDPEKILSRRVLVRIHRDQTDERLKVIWAHEFPILEAVFGEGNVELKEAALLDDGYTPKASAEMTPFNKKQDKVQRPSDVASLGFVFTGDAQSEYLRLEGVYGKHPDVNQPWVQAVYGRFAEGKFERMLGLAEYSDMPDAQLRSIVLGHDYLPQLTPDASREDRQAVEAKRAELMAMQREPLLALVEDLAGALA